MSKQEQYDAIIIGAGQSGTPLSTTLANAGWKVALVEREHVGGSKLHSPASTHPPHSHDL